MLASKRGRGLTLAVVSSAVLLAGGFADPVAGADSAVTEGNHGSITAGPVAPPLTDKTLRSSPDGAAGVDYREWFGWEPLGIIGGPWVRTYSLGFDRWEVFLCRPPGSVGGPDLATFMDWIAGSGIADYFSWWSDGRYKIRFWPGAEIFADGDDCEAAVYAASSGLYNGAVIAHTYPQYNWAAATPGFDLCQYGTDGVMSCPPSARRFPANGRTVFIPAPFFQDYIGSAIHELGHTLSWPHSFSGTTVATPNTWMDQYDNQIDVMSASWGTGHGTAAVNRYAAGWIEPGGVFVFRGQEATFWLAAHGAVGSELLVIRGEDTGVFYALDARVNQDRYDPLDQLSPGWIGVEAYRIDQRPDVCLVIDVPCGGVSRHTQLQPATATSLSDNILKPGDSLIMGSALVQILYRDGDRYRVRVGPHDAVTCQGLEATIVGHDYAETLNGTPGPDVIAGLGGDDVISGGGGNDVICGGAGNDLIYGGGGLDRLFGDDGQDRIFGGPGPDFIEGGAGADRLHGRAMDDLILGGNGNDRLFGEAGNDRLAGGLGRDQAIGGPGNDSCVAETATECERDF